MGSRLILVLAMLAALLPAQEPANKFRITAGDGVVKGTSEYRIGKSAEGVKVTSTTHLDQGGQAIEQSEEQTLSPDWVLIRYRLEESVGGEKHLFEAWHEGTQVEMRVTAGNDSRSRSTLFHPRTQVLDKLLPGHFQVLLDRISGKTQGNEEWLVLIPQELAVVSGKLTPAGEDSGTLDGKKIILSKYNLQLGSMVLTLWAQRDTNLLMRVASSTPKIELTRDGFKE